MPRLCGACGGRIEDNQHFKECSICHRSFHLDHRCDEHPQARMVVIAPRYIPRRPEPPPTRFRLFSHRADPDETPPERTAAPQPETTRTPRIEVDDAPSRRYRPATIGAILAAVVLVAVAGGGAMLGMWSLPGNFGSSPAGNSTDAQSTPAPSPAKSQAAVQAEATRDAQLARSETKYGPADGTLDVEAGSAQPALTSAGASLRDPLIRARFTNPGANTGSWDFGFVVRHSAETYDYRLAITSRGEWICERFSGEVDSPASRQHGRVTSLRTGPGQINDVQLLIIGKSGLLFVNDTYTATVDLSQAMKRGDVLIGAGFFPEHRTAAQTIVYSDFQVSARGGNPEATPAP